MWQNLNPLDSLLVSRHNDANTATSDISKADVETTEFIPNDKEHAKWLLRVFYFWQEIRFKAERKSNLGWLIKVGLENVSGKHSDQQIPIPKRRRTYLLKIKKLSRTCKSCLLGTERLILSYNSSSVRGWVVCNRWYDRVGLIHLVSESLKGFWQQTYLSDSSSTTG